MLHDLVAFAARFNVAAADAYVLPALFERSAQKVGMSPRALVTEATYNNPALGDYLAKAAKQVAQLDREAA